MRDVSENLAGREREVENESAELWNLRLYSPSAKIRIFTFFFLGHMYIVNKKKHVCTLWRPLPRTCILWMSQEKSESPSQRIFSAQNIVRFRHFFEISVTRRFPFWHMIIMGAHFAKLKIKHFFKWSVPLAFANSLSIRSEVRILCNLKCTSICFTP